MSAEVKQGFFGLVTNVAETQALAGALRVAENVVLRRPGALEPRPGAYAYPLGWTPSATLEMRRLWSFAGSDFAYSRDGSTDAWHKLLSASAVTYTKPDGSAVAPPPFRADLIPTAQARGNSCLGTQLGVQKLVAGFSSFSQVGVLPNVLFQNTALPAAGAALANNMKVGYRLVAVRTDAGGLVTRSVPTGAVTVSNTSGGTVNVSYAVTKTTVLTGDAGWFATDQIEVYRTGATPTANVLNEEYALVATLQITSGDHVLATDTLTDAQRGAALYTSPSRGGAILENDRPPACGCMESFRGSLFFANTVGPFQTTFSLNYGGNVSGSATGIGYRTTTGDITNGSAVIINLASTTGLQVGQIVARGAASWPNGTYIVSVDSATQVTVSAPSIHTAAAAGMTFFDAIEVNGTWHSVTPVWINAGTLIISPQQLLEQSLYAITASTATSKVNTGSTTFTARSITPAAAGYQWTFLLSEILRSAPSATGTIRATHGDQYSPALPLGTAIAQALQRDVFPGGISWSKPDEPEHVAPVNYAFVGDQNKAVLALACTRDSLFVLKEDGIWRLTGSSGTWRIDPFDTTAVCLLPSSVAKLNGRIYALTNKGIVSISEAGVQIISAPITNEVASLIRAMQTAFAATGVYTSPDGGWAGAANERDSEYVLLVGSVMPTLRGALVWNENTQAWTTWQFSASGAAGFAPSSVTWSQSLARLLIGATTGKVKQLATPDETDGLGHGARIHYDDLTSGVTITSGSPSTITYSPAFQLAAGDVIADGAGVMWRVTAPLTSASASVAGPSGSTPATGAGAKLVRPVQCSVQPAAFTVPDIDGKVWVNALVGFTKIVGVSSMTLSFGSTASIDAIVETLGYTLEAATGAIHNEQGQYMRHPVPRNHVRGWVLRMKLAWASVYGDAVLEMIGAESRLMSTMAKQPMAVGS